MPFKKHNPGCNCCPRTTLNCNCECLDVTLGNCTTTVRKYTLTVAGFTDDQCETCESHNGTFNLCYDPDLGYWISEEDAICGQYISEPPPPVLPRFQLQSDASYVYVKVNRLENVGGVAVYRVSNASFNCSTSTVLSLFTTGIGDDCNEAATVTVAPCNPGRSIPCCLALFGEDTFDRADDSTLGTDWTETSGTWLIRQNAARTTSALALAYFDRTAQPFGNPYMVVQTRCRGPATTTFRVYASYASAADCVMAELQLSSYVGGINTLKLYVNGTLRVTTTFGTMSNLFNTWLLFDVCNDDLVAATTVWYDLLGQPGAKTYLGGVSTLMSTSPTGLYAGIGTGSGTLQRDFDYFNAWATRPDVYECDWCGPICRVDNCVAAQGAGKIYVTFGNEASPGCYGGASRILICSPNCLQTDSEGNVLGVYNWCSQTRPSVEVGLLLGFANGNYIWVLHVWSTYAGSPHLLWHYRLTIGPDKPRCQDIDNVVLPLYQRSAVLCTGETPPTCTLVRSM